MSLDDSCISLIHSHLYIQRRLVQPEVMMYIIIEFLNLLFLITLNNYGMSNIKYKNVYEVNIYGYKLNEIKRNVDIFHIYCVKEIPSIA